MENWLCHYCYYTHRKWRIRIIESHCVLRISELPEWQYTSAAMCYGLVTTKSELTVWCCLHWHWFTEWAPPCSVLSCHLHNVLSVRFQSSHCVLLNHSRQGDDVWRSVTTTLTILQDVGSDGTSCSLHWLVMPSKLDAKLWYGWTPCNVETGRCHFLG